MCLLLCKSRDTADDLLYYFVNIYMFFTKLKSLQEHSIILCHIKKRICAQLNYDKILTRYLECSFYTYLKITMLNLSICYQLTCSYIKRKHK